MPSRRLEGGISATEQELRRGFVPLLQRIAMALASGFVLMFYSEFYFLNEDPGAEFAALWRSNPVGLFPWLGEFSFFYATWGSVMLTYIGLFRVRSFWSLIIAGAIFGWAVEGIMITVMYLDLPGSIIWPSVGWHALVDVLVGWYLIRRVLHRNNYLLTALVAAALGIFWGVWSTWYWVDLPRDVMEVPPLPADVFAPYAFVLTGLLILAYIVMDKYGGLEFRPTRIEIGLLMIWHGAWFALGAAVQAPAAVLILPALLLGASVLLWRNRRSETRPSILTTLSGRVRWGQYAVLLLMPVCAIPVYWLMYDYDVRLPVLPAIAMPLAHGSTVLLILSVIAILLRRPGGKDGLSHTATHESSVRR
jgi:hypothetical protein